MHNKILNETKMYNNFRLTKFLYLLPALLFVATSSMAQVTIGSDEKPIKGAILQLKNIDNITDGGANATKGLLLPRVSLLSTQIKADETGAKDNLANTIQGVDLRTEKWDKNNHIGTVVYNTNYCTKGGKGPGLYIWDANAWAPMQTQSYSGAVSTMTDPRDGEKYTTRSFGTAGIWMTEALRFVPKSDDPVYTNYTHGSIELRTGKKGYTYAQGEVYPGQSSLPYDVNTAKSTWYKKGGVFYSAGAALNDAKIFMPAHYPAHPFDESQTAAGVDQTLMKQGICPTGWHVPSDKEWNDLERELYTNTKEYSYGEPAKDAQGNIIPWNPAWEYGWYDYPTSTRPPGMSFYRLGRQALNNIFSCVEDIQNNMYTTFGKAGEEGGFNLRPFGFLEDNQGIQKQGREVRFSTSSVSLLNKPNSYGGYDYVTILWVRSMAVNGTGIYRYDVSDEGQYSVRCKKN